MINTTVLHLIAQTNRLDNQIISNNWTFVKKRVKKMQHFSKRDLLTSVAVSVVCVIIQLALIRYSRDVEFASGYKFKARADYSLIGSALLIIFPVICALAILWDIFRCMAKVITLRKLTIDKMFTLVLLNCSLVFILAEFSRSNKSRWDKFAYGVQSRIVSDNLTELFTSTLLNDSLRYDLIFKNTGTRPSIRRTNEGLLVLEWGDGFGHWGLIVQGSIIESNPNLGEIVFVKLSDKMTFFASE